MITDNYGKGLAKEIEQYTNLRNIAMVLHYDEDVIDSLNQSINIIQILLNKHMEVMK